jgi:NADH-quinone oxidoreductase subunit M
VSDLSLVVVAIPALGALVIAIAARRPKSAASSGERSLLAPGESAEIGASASDPHRRGETSLFRGIAAIFAVCTLVASLCLSLAGRYLNLKIGVGANDCSAAFALLTAATWLPVAYVARRSDHRRPALLYGLLLLLESSYLAIFSCDNAIWLCAALQVNSVLLYLVASGWSAEAHQALARKMLFVNLAADLAILVGLMGVVIASARVSAPEPNAIPRLSYSLSEITRDFPRVTTDDVAAQEYWKHAQRTLLSILILGAAVKAPLVPFHAWLVGVVAEGPLCVGIALVGPGLRIGLYLLARFIGPLCGDLGGVADLIVGLTVLGAFLESLLTYGQANLKNMIACVLLLQGSLAVAGFFSMRVENASGPLMLTLASGVAGVLILFSLGVLELRYGTADLSSVGGIVHKLPNLAAVLLLATLSLVGIPGLFGFPGLFATLGAVFGGEWTFAFLALGACLIGAWALFSMLQHLVFGSARLPVPADGDVLIDGTIPDTSRVGSDDPPHPSPHTDSAPPAWSMVTEGRSASIDLGSKELLLLAPLLASLVVLGIWPQAISALLHLALVGASLSP